MDNFSRVKSQVNILEVAQKYMNLKRSGRTYMALCPFHGEKTPSFSIDPKKQLFNCFGQCDKKGDVIDLVQELEGFKSPLEALQKLAADYNIILQGIDEESYKLKKKEVAKKRNEAAGYFKTRNKAVEYLANRGISEQVARLFGIGYNEKNHSITIPIQNAYSEVVGMAERFLNTEPKYKNSPESEVFKKSELLYGLDKARKDADTEIYIVEGYFDVLAMYEFSKGKTVAYCGQSITDGQARLLSQYITKQTKIFLIPDKDLTGQNFIRKNISVLRTYNKNIIGIVDLPSDCKDINDYLMTGRKFEDLKIVPQEMFLLKQDLDNCLQVEDEYQVAYEYAKRTHNKMIRSDMAHYLSKRWNKSIDLVNSHMDSDKTIIDYTSKLFTASESWTSYTEKVKDGQKNKIFTNLNGLDRVLKGVKPTEVMTILGRSGAGKTTFILNLIYNLIFVQKKNIVFASLELPKESVIPQIVQIHNKMSAAQVEKLADTGEYNEGIAEVIEKFDKHWRIADENGQTLEDIEMLVRAANENVFDEPIKVLFVDYFQYIKSKSGKSDYNEKSDMARELKALAKRLDVLLIVLTQANREGGGSGADKLDLKSARDTGAIEESSDYMLGVYRPAANPKLDEEERQSIQNEMYCQILKNRWGPTGEVKLYFEGITKRIEDWKDGK